MKKRITVLPVLALCVALLSGCLGKNDFAASLVQNNIDLLYLNKYSDAYIKEVNLTAEEADDLYEDGISQEIEFFCNYEPFSIDLSLCDDSIEPQIRELYHQIYAMSKYEVGEQSVTGDKFLVDMTIYPIDIFQKVLDEDYEDFYLDMQTRAGNGEFEEMDDAEFEMIWAQAIIDMVNARIEDIGYLDPETISVQVVRNDGGAYEISSNDLGRIDALIIAY